MRRVIDIVIGGIIALVALPLILMLALVGAGVFRANPFFVQSRVGSQGEEFRLLKLRSLPVATPKYADKYALREVPVPRFGRLIRRLHLDELPQLFHVPLGQMSLVGPRPEMRFLHDQLDDRFARARVSVRPGCTGLWQVSAASEQLILETPEYDSFYLRHRTLRLDLWILWHTVRKVAGIGKRLTLADVPGWALRDREVPATVAETDERREAELVERRHAPQTQPQLARTADALRS